MKDKKFPEILCSFSHDLILKKITDNNMSVDFFQISGGMSFLASGPLGTLSKEVSRLGYIPYCSEQV